MIKKGKLKYYSKKCKRIKYRQQLTTIYHRNSVAYVVNSNLLREKKLIMNNNTGAYIIKDEQISIDTLKDLSYVNKILRK